MTTRAVADLVAEARHARERYELYRARVYGPSLTSLARLRELEQVSRLAERRLRTVQARQESDPQGRFRPEPSRDEG